jgi:hypothetical protein
MEQVLDVYRMPYDEDFPVVCMDESPKQLIRETRIPLAMGPGKEKKVDFEYERKGVCNIFMANEPLKGTRHVEVRERKTKRDWAYFIRDLADIHYRGARKINLVMDNLNTHSASALYEVFRPEEAKRIWDRYNFIYTPKHGSWLNIGDVTTKAVREPIRHGICPVCKKGRLVTLFTFDSRGPPKHWIKKLENRYIPPQN